MAIQHEINQKIIQDVITKADLHRYFEQLGLKAGMIVYVQSKMEQYAHITGGIDTIITALQEVLSSDGTLIMPAFSEDLIDPASNHKEIFERDLYDEIRQSMTPFHKKRTMSSNLMANQLMYRDGVFRSNHPTHSCVAWGKYAKLICDRHPLHFSLGKNSFLDKLSEMNGYVLLLGVPYKECDIFKYAACLSEHKPIRIVSCPIEKKSGMEFIPLLDMEYSSKGIHQVRVMMEEREIVKENFIGNAHVRFFKAKEAATLAQAYFNSF